MVPIHHNNFTPLECLLVFQALRHDGVDGVDGVNFNKISQDLQRVPLITTDALYDASRLAPESLSQLYLQLLNEEVKRDLEGQVNGDGLDGDVSPGARKRKAPSPSLPTVEEASQHAHLIPKLVARLYTRYRDNTIREIRAIEQRHDGAVRDIEEAKAKASRQAEQAAQKQPTSANHSPKTAVPTPAQPAAIDRRDHVQTPVSATASPSSPRPSGDANSQPPPKRYSKAGINDMINHGPEPQDNHGSHSRNHSATSLPPLSEMAPQSRFNIPPNIPPTHGMQHSPHITHGSPYAPPHGHPPNAMGSPHVQSAVSRPSSSPRPILPPPPGMQYQPQAPLPASPSMHAPPYQQPHQPYSPVHRLSTGGQSATDRQQRPYPSHQATPPPQYYQNPPYQDRRTSYPAHQHPPGYPYQGQPAQPGGYMLPPFPATPQDPQAAAYHHQQPVAQQHVSRGQQTLQFVARAGHYSHPPSAPPTAPRPAAPPQQRLLGDVLAALATPPRNERKPLWKPSTKKTRPPMFRQGSPERGPESEPMSPPKPRAPAPAKLAPSVQLPEPEVSDLPSGPTKRGLRRGARQQREGSVASSTVDGSLRGTRSQSVASMAASDGRPGSRRTVKNEPSTPADTLGETEDSEQTPVTGTGRRTRRGTLTQQPAPSSKRKRQQSLEVDNETTPEPANRSTVTATRNFAKMCSTIMNDIQSHKHGSRFAAPVKSKDITNYTDIIKRPQDLKTIRAAITAGARAISAATGENPTSASETTVELPVSEDLVPPKAIVNGAQLEKEVMRMLANAVMFNPGEDGMVADTREMAEDVERRLREWRGVPDSVDESVEEEGGKGKRRKG